MANPSGATHVIPGHGTPNTVITPARRPPFTPTPTDGPKPKAVARRAVTPGIRAQYRAQYGAGFKQNPTVAASFQTARKAAVKKQMGK